MPGAIDLYAGKQPIAGSNLFTVDKNPLNQLDSGVEDVMGKQAGALGNAMWSAIQMVIDSVLGIKPNSSQSGTGQVNWIVQMFDNLLTMLGLSNTSGGSNDPTSSAWNLNTLITWVEQLLLPTNSVAPIVGNANNSGGVTGFVPMENLAMTLIGDALGSVQGLIDAILSIVGFAPGSGTEADINTFFNDIYLWLGQPALTNSAYNAATAVENWVTSLLHPTNMVAPMNPVTQLINAINIPNITLAMSTDMQSIIDSFANTFLGLPGSGYTINDLIRSIESIPGQLITGTLSAAQSSGINIGTLSGYLPQYLVNGNFDTANSIVGQTVWTWDGTQGPPGVSTSVYTTANGTVRELYSNPLYVSGPVGDNPGQTVAISAMTRWATLSGGTIALTVAKYNGATLVGYDTIATVPTPSGTQTTWQTLAGNYTVPTGVTTLFVRPMVGADATAGQVWFGKMSAQVTNASFVNLYNNMTNNAQAIANMQAANIAGSVSGVSVNINFSNYPNGALPSIFTNTYSGTGTSILGVNGGNAQWTTPTFNVPPNNETRTALSIYNVAPTVTDYQVITGTMAATPSSASSGGTPRVWVLGRVDSYTNPQNYVWARGYANGFLSWAADVGYTVAGVDTVLTSNVPLTWSVNMVLVVGASGNPRRYQLFSGGAIIADVTEAGTASQIGAGFRYWGGKSEMKSGYSASVTPGSIAGTSITDNAPPATVGSYAYVTRLSTTTAPLTGGAVDTVLPTNFWDTSSMSGGPARVSSDITFDPVNGTFKVSREGTYTFKGRFNLNGNNATAALFVNLHKALAGQPWSTHALEVAGPPVTSQTTYSTQWLWTEGDVYLKAGEQVGLSTYNSSVTVNWLQGESTGRQNFFSLALANWSTQ